MSGNELITAQTRLSTETLGLARISHYQAIVATVDPAAVAVAVSVAAPIVVYPPP